MARYDYHVADNAPVPHISIERDGFRIMDILGTDSASQALAVRLVNSLNDRESPLAP